MRKLCSTTWEPKHTAFILNPVLNCLLNRQALIWSICIGDIVTTPGPWKWSYISLWCWNKAMQLLSFWRTMSLSVVHIFSGKCHCAHLVLARSVVNEAIITWFKNLGFGFRVINCPSFIPMTSLDIEIGKYTAIGLSRDLQSYAVSLAKSTSLPRTQKVEETTQPSNNKDRYGTPSSVVS